jgi:hypothetical protein
MIVENLSSRLSDHFVQCIGGFRKRKCGIDRLDRVFNLSAIGQDKREIIECDHVARL